ncbi:MAG TPA: glutamate synthase, partial [Nannocystis exedens]|nr:glutamate synthase [Nannocystis exedens]
FATDAAFERGDRFFTAGPDSGKRVALLGGGPASLAAAHELRRRGHACTIFEQSQLLGGLSTTGVAPYKMRADRAIEEVDWVLGIGGIEVRLGVSVGREITVQELLRDYDAVFVGLGLGADRLLQLPGAELQGIRGAVEWIAEFKTGTCDLQAVRRALVIGGGNTAVDAVRELHGLGVAEVTMAYRGDEARMSGYQHEWRGAKIAGVRGLWNVQPLAYEGGSDGRVSAVRFAELDAQRQPIAGRERSVNADLVLLAIGQGRLGSLLGEIDGISLDRGRLVVDDEGRTSHPKIYAGGDCANGGKEVVNAVAEGKRAAIAIDRDLCEGEAS